MNMWWCKAWVWSGSSRIVTSGEGLSVVSREQKSFVRHAQVFVDLSSWALPLCFISGVLIDSRENMRLNPWCLRVLCFGVSIIIRGD